MNAIELRKIVRLHRLWLDGDMKGVRADLSDADLTNADLSDADLSDADLSNANLRNANLINADLSNANLRWANLHNANLRYADLSNANLHDANLRYANLRNANLHNADLRYTAGDGVRIHTIQTGAYVVVICGQIVSIDCQSHKWSDWMGFDDTSIRNMDGQRALDFWRVWKPILTAIMEAR